MSKTGAVLIAIALLLLALGVLLSTCGGEEDDTTPDAAATEGRSGATTPGGAGGGEGEGAGATGAGPSDGSGSADGKGAGDSSGPDSLATDPNSIRGARVTATGAVQTLPPSESSQAEALENSYSSIKGFGEEAEGSEATEITFALLQYLIAKAEGDWATACARLYSLLRANLDEARGGCAAAYGELISRVPASSRAEAARIDVASVRRGADDRAFVIYKTPATASADMPMYLEGGVWTVGALEAYALTPEQLRENQG